MPWRHFRFFSFIANAVALEMAQTIAIAKTFFAFFTIIVDFK